MPITLTRGEMVKRLAVAFATPQTEALVDILDEIRQAEIERAASTQALKEGQARLTAGQARLTEAMVNLAAAQERTEQRMEGLAMRMEGLAAAQERTEQRVEGLVMRMDELAVAQKETQHEIQTLTRRMGELGTTVGGLGNSMGYALENEAYRLLPPLLKEKYGLEMTERFVRTYIGGREINLFGRAKRGGQELLIVGEVKSRLDERRKKSGQKAGDIWAQLSAQVARVKEAYPDIEIMPLIVTHHARPGALQQAEEAGIIVVQSFEW